MRRAVEVAVLREAAVGLLLAVPEVVERAARRGAVPGRDLRRRHLVEVARPDEVVRPGVAGDRAPHPGHRRRRDAGARVRLVLQRGHHHQRHVVERPSPGGAARPLEAGEVRMPAVRVVPGGRPEAPTHERRRGGAPRLRRGGREAERDRRPAPALEAVHRDPGGVDDVPGRARAVIGPVHAEVVAQVRPPVAGAHVPVRHAPRRRIALQRHGVAVVPRREPLRAVVVAAVGERGIKQRVELVRAAREGPQAHAHEDGGPVRVGDVGLRDPPARGAGRVDLAVREAAPVDELDAVPGILPLALRERPPVGHDELEVAHARGAEVRRVDLSHGAVVEGQPDLAVAPGRGAHPVLVALGPARNRSRCTGSLTRGSCARDGPEARCAHESQHHTTIDHRQHLPSVAYPVPPDRRLT